MDETNLASAKAQWEHALKGAIQSFRLLSAESDSKSWKPVIQPVQASSTYLGGSNVPSSLSSPITTGSGATTLPRPARDRTVTPQSSLLFNPAFSPSRTGNATKGKAIERGILSTSPERNEAATASSRLAPPELSSFSPLRVDPSSVKVHRRSGGRATGLPAGVDIYRAVVDVSFEGAPDLDPFRSALVTPEARTKWDRMVDEAETIEMLDPQTRITKTNFRLGWPASPRDAICISRSISDANTLIDVSTSLKRSADAPAYLRPAPPYVRSHVHLAAWCIQLPDKDADNNERSRIRVTLFWSWDIKGMWVGMPPGGLGSHAVSLVTGLLSFVRKGSSHLPSLQNFGSAVEILSTAYDASRDTLATEYCVIADEGGEAAQNVSAQSLIARQKALGNGIEFALPAEEGWDVKVKVRRQRTIEDGEGSAAQVWQAAAERQKGSRGALSNLVVLRLQHISPADQESTRIGVTIQRIAASSDIRLRINDETRDILEIEAKSDTDPILDDLEDADVLSDTAGLSCISTASLSSQDIPRSSSSHSDLRSHKHTESVHQFSSTKRSAAIASIVRRNYIYFTSMLQEPEAKWKHLSDSKGVSVTQLDSIDPTLVVYRAEATFVGVGVWDILASVSSPGTRSYWDKSLDESKLLEDLGDVSAVWHTKTKAAWPVSARDTVMVETAYKSPSSVHLFSFSTDDRGLFPGLPGPSNGTIRTQVDLRGWSIESLSPTTVHVTLIEQSDPKGWTSKSATASLMTNAVAGVGEYAIKMGAPPVLTRLLGATLTDVKYDHERASYRFEYCQDLEHSSTAAQHVECEIRCDIEGWCHNLDLVVDPPPINVSCLRRHRLSPGGGGVWLTIEHVLASLEDDTAKITVRKGSAGSSDAASRGTVTVNGAKMRVDIDELKESELAQLKDKKRSKPQRIPLDLLAGGRAGASVAAGRRGSASVSSLDSYSASVPSRVGTPTPLEDKGTPTQMKGTPFSDKQPKNPVTPALDVLFLLRRIYAERSPDPGVNPAGWALVSHRNGLYVRRKLMASISSTVAVQRGDKVVQGVTAEDLVAAVSSLGCRKQWDDRVESVRHLESYGNGVTTSFFTSTGAFPFRGRGFYLASLTAKALPAVLAMTPTSPSSSNAQGVFYHASASFPEQASRFDALQLNQASYPIGKVLIDGWIFETLDPYNSTLNYQIPSTRCTHIVAIDYAGSLPIAVNTIWNSNLPRSILAVENFLKSRGAVPTVRAPPACLQVLGDGRDEDHDFSWATEPPSGTAPQSLQQDVTLLSSSFTPSVKRLEVVVRIQCKAEKAAITGNGSAGNALGPSTPKKSSTRTPAALISSPSASKPTVSDRVPNTPLNSSTTISEQTLLHRSSSSSLHSSATLKTPTPSIFRMPRITLANQSPQTGRPPVIAEVEIELKHYMSGYKIEIFSELSDVREKGIEGDAHGGPSLAKVSLSSAAIGKKHLPINATVYDLPPSALLAATLDPSARPRRHLLRLSLPLETFNQKDGVNGASHEDTDWRRLLSESGATVRIIVRPVRSEAPGSGTSGVQATTTASLTEEQKAEMNTEAEEMDSQSVPVHLGGEQLEVVHVNQTSAMLQREHEMEPILTKLKRIPRRDYGTTATSEALDDHIPPTLAEPIAIALELTQAPAPLDQPARPTATIASSPTAAQSNRHANTPAESIDAVSKQSGAGGQVGANVQKREPTVASTATTSLMGLLQSYPLSRLSASTAVSTVSANGEAGLRERNGDPSKGPVDKGKASIGGGGSGQPGSPGRASTDAGILGTNVPKFLGGRLFHEARYSLATLLLVALICFLAGSLVRAMLSPADFIFYPQNGALSSSTSQSSSTSNGAGLQGLPGHAAGAAAAEIQRMLGQHHQDYDGSNMPVGDRGGAGAIAWRRMLRLVEVKRAIAGRFDLILAVVDRRL